MAEDMTPLYQAIVDRVPAPNVDLDGTLQMQISQLDYNNYVGVIGIGRIKRGKVKPNQQVTIIDSEGKTRNGKVGKVLTHLGLERIESDIAEAGDIIAITGLGELNISDTICDTQAVEALPALSVDEPTVRAISAAFQPSSASSLTWYSQTSPALARKISSSWR
jgi:GTP-binding protein